MIRNITSIITAVLLGVLLFTDNAVSVPLTFTHQGRLMNGATPANGFFDIEYGLYDAAVGGNLLWSETHNGVKVTDGLFIVELGTTATFFDVFPDPPPPGWLQIQIVGEATPISPRTKLSGSPFAILANGVSSRRPIPGSLDTAKIDMQTTSTGSSLRLRVVPTAQTTGRSVSMEATQQGGEIAIGDPDFDLLRITGDATGANMSLTGDPDFDLLRMSANADSAVIAMHGQSIGDPDFDLLRIVGGPSSTSMRLGGDPDFDLLRISADADSAEIEMSGQDIGDPDFDLLKIVGKEGSGSMTMQVKNSIGNIRRITQSVDSGGGSIAINEEGVVKFLIYTDGPSSNVLVHEAGNRSFMSVNSVGGYIAIDEEGVEKITMSTGGTSSRIAVNEEGVQIAIRVDSGGAGSFAINEPGVGNKVSLDSDGDGYLSNSLKIGTTAGTNHIEVVGGANCNGTTWNNASDANSKENFQQIDGEQILEKLEDLEITRWNYIGRDDAEHIGPTAQDFYKAFGVGSDDKTISTVDPSGIALAAIKELYKKSKEVDELKKQLEELTKAVEKLAKERK